MSTPNLMIRFFELGRNTSGPKVASFGLVYK
jgi:hypothetical protein